MKTAKTSPLIFTRSIKVLIAFCLYCTVAHAAELRGRVLDESGAVIAGAQVQLLSQNQNYHTMADSAGNFFIQSPAGSGTLRISAPGFSPSTVEWSDSASPLLVTLKPAPVAEQIVVTAERAATRLDQTAANVAVLTSAELNSRSAVTLDDALRQVPGFTLFRRNNSLTANPTTQGASARGVGGSGASRLLVLEDGVPLNDPFGGWVFWDRVPRITLDRAEVLRGGGSALFGSDAFSGVVDLVTRTPNSLGSFESAGDSLNGHDVQGQISRQFTKWTITADGENFGNDGAFVVAAEDRGIIDTPATLQFSNGRVLVQRSLAGADNAFISGSLFSEQRNNGTALQINSTHLGEISGGIDRTVGHNIFSARIYGSGEHYHQSFSAISADRNSEALTRWQTVSSDQIGFSMNWSRPISSANLLIGADGRFIHGQSDETVFVANLPTSLVSAGGRSNLMGVFAQVSQTFKKRLRLSAGLRFDWWLNTDGFNRTAKISDVSTAQTLLDPHNETVWSPRLGAIYDLAPQWQLTASAYESFRAPILNELYRSFRLGNILTLANDQLRAEHLYGGETGIRYLHRRVMVSGSFFQQNVENPVANITQAITAALITRQRENLGSLRARGSDLDLLLILPHIQLRTGYEYVHSVVSSFSANPTLVGKKIPQVPGQTATFSGTFTARAWTLVALVRTAGRQFDDDLNQFPLQPYSVTGVSISKQIGRWTWFASATNIFDTKIQVAATPVPNYALPRIISGGVRFAKKQ
ncbi:MAG: TonB-dependent receptor [Acidobacteriia bacterium]|nr:TonB-dependent receptor [Terriglobia bacterium]